MPSRLHCASRLLPAAVAAFALGLIATPAAAQGTAEQQEACTPDALKFCTSTIPDIPKTTACMKAHKAELSTRCQAAFDDATEKAPAAAAAGAAKRHRVRAAEAAPDTEAPRRPRHARAEAAPNREAPPRRRAARATPDDMDRGAYGPGPESPSPDGYAPDGYGPRQYDYMRPEDRADGPPPQGPRRDYDYAQPDGPDGPPPYAEPRDVRRADDRARAGAEIDRLCEDGMMDPRSCDLTERALRR